MEIEHQRAIDCFAPDLVNNIIPVDLLPSLSLCLTQDDREKICCDERNQGYRRATQTLLTILKKRPRAFREFINALNTHGLSYLATKLSSKEGTIFTSFPNYRYFA